MMKIIGNEQILQLHQLAAAIREGCKTTVKAKGDLFGNRADRRIDHQKACALGAAIIGAGLVEDSITGINALEAGDKLLFKLQQQFPVLLHPVLENGYSLTDRIVDLNDDSDWTREDIADYIIGQKWFEED